MSSNGAIRHAGLHEGMSAGGSAQIRKALWRRKGDKEKTDPHQ